MTTINKFLKLISDNRKLGGNGGKPVINGCDGSEIIANVKDIPAFIEFVDPNFKKWGADEKGPATEETLVQVYEMRRDGTFSQLFGSFNPHKVCLTQSQILNFVRNYRILLCCDGYETFFLFESKWEFFIAHVEFTRDYQLKIHVHRFGNSTIWLAISHHRVVIPQL
ncbi:hypothetical protein J7J13_02290 [bacterium]|nr:hypothetical protein [bacterium]